MSNRTKGSTQYMPRRMPLCVSQMPKFEKTDDGQGVSSSKTYKPNRRHPIQFKTSEHNEQALLFEWSKLNEGRYPELHWLFAIINGAKLPWRKNKYGQRYSSEANKLKRTGMKSGIFDTMLPIARGGYHGLFVEMKVKPNKESPEQGEFKQFVTEQGYKAVVCYSFEEAKCEITNYLIGTETVVVKWAGWRPIREVHLHSVRRDA